MATSLSYQTATEFISSPFYRKASSIPEYFDIDSEKDEIKEDPFESTHDEEEVDEFLEKDSDPFSEVDEFLDNDSDPFVSSDIDPFLVKDVDPFLLEERDLFEEVDEFNQDDIDPFVIDDMDIFKANGLTDQGFITDDPFMAEEGMKSYDLLDGDDPFLKEENYDNEESDDHLHYTDTTERSKKNDNLYSLIFSLQHLGLLCLIIALLILLVKNH